MGAGPGAWGLGPGAGGRGEGWGQKAKIQLQHMRSAEQSVMMTSAVSVFKVKTFFLTLAVSVFLAVCKVKTQGCSVLVKLRP